MFGNTRQQSVSPPTRYRHRCRRRPSLLAHSHTRHDNYAAKVKDQGQRSRSKFKVKVQQLSCRSTVSTSSLHLRLTAIVTSLLRPPHGVGVRGIVMSMSVCLSVRSRNSKTTRPNFNKFIMHAAVNSVYKQCSFLYPPSERSETGVYIVFTYVCVCVCPSVRLCAVSI